MDRGNTDPVPNPCSIVTTLQPSGGIMKHSGNVALIIDRPGRLEPGHETANRSVCSGARNPTVPPPLPSRAAILWRWPRVSSDEPQRMQLVVPA